MPDKKEFLVLRYSLIEENQSQINAESLPSPKGQAVLASIIKDREFTLNGVLYSFVGFAEVRYFQNSKIESLRFFIGKFAKRKKAHMGVKVPGDIVETEEDDWLPLLTIFDLRDQYIFVAKDWRFGTPEQTVRAMQGGLREPVLARYNHRVFVEGKTRGESFWKVVRQHKRIYKLELRLISPNILETNLRAREALAALKQLFAQDQVDVTLNSDAGQLKVPEEPVASYLEYIEEGEGTWALTTEGVHGGKKKHSSSENIVTALLDVDAESTVESVGQLKFEIPDIKETAITPEMTLIDQILNEIESYRER
ncbi:hypothetical protein [Hydrogenophaga sp. ZJX-1]|uniref:hypothetical protein n=1 Tax=Hydrogenophaga sp. ZJX-1 TaxID=3404778 RepID=UPI003B281C6A